MCPTVVKVGRVQLFPSFLWVSWSGITRLCSRQQFLQAQEAMHGSTHAFFCPCMHVTHKAIATAPLAAHPPAPLVAHPPACICPVKSTADIARFSCLSAQQACRFAAGKRAVGITWPACYLLLLSQGEVCELGAACPHSHHVSVYLSNSKLQHSQPWRTVD
jgi:hypothetical protein